MRPNSGNCSGDPGPCHHYVFLGGRAGPSPTGHKGRVGIRALRPCGVTYRVAYVPQCSWVASRMSGPMSQAVPSSDGPQGKDIPFPFLVTTNPVLQP